MIIIEHLVIATIIILMLINVYLYERMKVYNKYYKKNVLVPGLIYRSTKYKDFRVILYDIFLGKAMYKVIGHKWYLSMKKEDFSMMFEPEKEEIKCG